MPSVPPVPEPNDISDDVRHMLAAGESLEEIAKRLGMKVGSVGRNLYRHGHPEMGRKFNALDKRLRKAQQRRQY